MIFESRDGDVRGFHFRNLVTLNKEHKHKKPPQSPDRRKTLFTNEVISEVEKSNNTNLQLLNSAAETSTTWLHHHLFKRFGTEERFCPLSDVCCSSIQCF